MRAHFVSNLLLVAAIALGLACEPSEKCSGELYYDAVNLSCRACPADATFKDGTCVCPDQMEFVDQRCQWVDGAVRDEPEPPEGESDAATGSGATCDDYCDFVGACIGDNPLAVAALPEVVSGLDADDRAACIDGCRSATGGDGSGDAVVACIDDGVEAAACVGDDTPDGLTGGIGLMLDCCRGEPGNALCDHICAGLGASALVADMLDFCD